VTPPPPATTASYRHDEVTDSGAYSAVHVAEPAVHVIRASKVERSIERERENGDRERRGTGSSCHPSLRSREIDREREQTGFVVTWEANYPLFLHRCVTARCRKGERKTKGCINKSAPDLHRPLIEDQLIPTTIL
jgi:hypothetical protein